MPFLLSVILTFKVIGIDCSACAKPVIKALSSVAGVTNVQLDWRKATARIVPDGFDRLRIRTALNNAGTPSVSGQYQTLSRWSGAIDEGSGFQNGGMQLQLSAPLGAFVVAPGVYRELWSHGFQEQTFRQGTTWSLNVSRQF